MADAPAFGTHGMATRETVIRMPRKGGMPKEILTIPEYWSPPVGHIFFINGHGFEVTAAATFFHLNGGDFNTQASVISVRERPEL